MRRSNNTHTLEPYLPVPKKKNNRYVANNRGYHGNQSRIPSPMREDPSRKPPASLSLLVGLVGSARLASSATLVASYLRFPLLDSPDLLIGPLRVDCILWLFSVAMGVGVTSLELWELATSKLSRGSLLNIADASWLAWLSYTWLSASVCWLRCDADGSGRRGGGEPREAKDATCCATDWRAARASSWLSSADIVLSRLWLAARSGRSLRAKLRPRSGVSGMKLRLAKRRGGSV